MQQYRANITFDFVNSISLKLDCYQWKDFRVVWKLKLEPIYPIDFSFILCSKASLATLSSAAFNETGSLRISSKLEFNCFFFTKRINGLTSFFKLRMAMVSTITFNHSFVCACRDMTQAIFGLALCFQSREKMSLTPCLMPQFKLVLVVASLCYILPIIAIIIKSWRGPLKLTTKGCLCY
ncbi:hypothetical protein FF38_11163 [Lucilia cuprina]|uniref:Uncharacterized protein n=1 Tax=Lucilia cuprina TaxID=7375 RepID=A0A0L0BXZ1_LUCCU|nr:hypothetical protein FF38_11163 [Lucilia cuprina]